VTLVLGVGGSLRPRLAGAGGVEFVGRDGAAVLRYGGLRAVDAGGRVLRAWLAVSAGRLLVRVDASGARYPLRVDPFIQQAKLSLAPDDAAYQFGFSVALSADGDTALVSGYDNSGCQTESDTPCYLAAGWVFTKSDGEWSQQAELRTYNAQMRSGMLLSVALSADGDTALVGVSAYDNDAGAVWVFTRSGSTWTQPGRRLTANGTGGGEFGSGVALSADGTTALISGPTDSPAAWVFTRSGSAWSQQGLITPPSDGTAQDGEITGTALSPDGSTVLIGDDAYDDYAGAAWVFSRSGAGWLQQGPLLEPTGEVGRAGFGGFGMALSAAGNTAMIAGGQDSSRTGAAWVFTRTNGAWTQQGPKLTASDEDRGGELGTSVSLSADGNTALIDAVGDNDEGAAWAFTRSGGVWSQDGAKLTGSDETADGFFGASSALSACASSALVGSGYGAYVLDSGSTPCSLATVVAAEPGLVGYWRLGEVEGSTAVDQTGANDGTYQGGYALGASGPEAGSRAVALNGSSGEVKLPSLGSSSDWTIEGWTDLSSAATGDNALFAGYRGPRLLITPTGVYADDLSTGTKAGEISHSTPSNLGAWVYWALVRNGSTLTVYRDGAAVASSSLGGEGATTLDGDIGAETNGLYHLDGDVSDVAVSVTVLSADTVYEHFELGSDAATSDPYAGAVDATAGLAGYWRLDESSGTTAADQTGADPGAYGGGYTLGAAGALAGDSDTAVALDGITGEVNLPSLGSSSDWTIEGWTHLSSAATGDNALFAGYRGPRLLITPTGVYADDLSTGTKAGQLSHSTPSNLGAWVYWALVRNGSALTVYRDGAAVASSSLGGEGATTLAGDIGAETNGTYHLNGDVDDVAVYQGALSADAVKAHYQLGADG
jgi:hypothetical protein